MVRILVTDGIEKKASETLRSLGFDVVEEFCDPETLKQKVKAFDVLVIRSATKVNASILDAAAEGGRLKLILRGGVGVDNIDVDDAVEKGIRVQNTPKSSAISVAELTLAHMFTLARWMHMANHSMRKGEWNKKQYEGVELCGKVLGLIGMGRIAREIAVRAQALGMRVMYTNQSGPKNDVTFSYYSLDDLLQKADFISLHIPGTQDKKPLIGEREFSLMKNGVYVINTARGGLISEEALLQALDNKKVAGAALDVFEEEPTKNERIFTHPRISLTPHIAASTKEAQARIGEEIVAIITATFHD